MANGLLELFPPNRLATFPEFHNLKGIFHKKSQSKKVLGIFSPKSGVSKFLIFSVKRACRRRRN